MPTAKKKARGTKSARRTPLDGWDRTSLRQEFRHRKKVVFTLSPAEVAAMDAASKAHGFTRSELLSQWVARYTGEHLKEDLALGPPEARRARARKAAP